MSLDVFERAEIRFILACLRSRAGAGEELPCSAERDGLDWDYILKASICHGVLPHIHRALSQEKQLNLPERFRQELQGAFRAGARKNLQFTGELLRLTDLLSAAGIRAVPHKGPALAAFIYDDISMRQFGDLDIIIEPHDLGHARDVILASGYKPRDDVEPEEGIYRRLGSEYVLERADGFVRVELHWQLSPAGDSSYMTPASVMGRCKSISLCGRVVPAMSAEDQLLLTAVHGGSHIWERLGWIYDTAILAETRDDMDWDAVMSVASRLGYRRLLLLALHLADDLMKARIPEKMAVEARSDADVASLAAVVYRYLQRPAPEIEDIPLRRRFSLMSRERRRDRMHFLANLAVSPSLEDWQSMPLPAKLFPLYHIVRPFRLTLKHFRIAKRTKT